MLILCGALIGRGLGGAARVYRNLQLDNITEAISTMSQPKVIVLTGASRGIGLAIGHYLLKHGSKVVLVARSEQPLRELEDQYRDQVAVVVGDFADLDLGKRAVETALKKWQCLDSVIVNHGVLDPVTRIAESSAAAWKQAFDVNIVSAVAISQAAVPALRQSKGSLLFTSSGAATSHYPAWGAYGAAKAALNHLAGTLASEEKDITSIAVRPGVVDTGMQRDIREKHQGVMDASDAARFAELKKSGGLLRPEQPGHVMAKLALDPPKQLSGKFLTWNAEELKAYQE